MSRVAIFRLEKTLLDNHDFIKPTRKHTWASYAIRSIWIVFQRFHIFDVLQSPDLLLFAARFDAGRSFVFSALLCFGGVLSAFRNARWKRSAMPGSSTTSGASVEGGFAGRFMAQ